MELGLGDGSTSSAKNPPHAFAEPGSYEVTLIASNAGGSDSVSQTVVAIDPPVASFEIDADDKAAWPLIN